MMLMMMRMKAVTESVLWPLENTVAKVFRFGECSKGKLLTLYEPPSPAAQVLAQGQGITQQASETPLLPQAPPWSPARVRGRPCQAGSHPQFPFLMPKSHEALRLPPLSPPQPTKLGLGALPGSLLGPELWQWWLLQDEETGSSPLMPEGGVAARP